MLKNDKYVKEIISKKEKTFINFSNEKSILIQTPGFSIAKLLYPPYTDFKKSIARKIPWFFN